MLEPVMSIKLQDAKPFTDEEEAEIQRQIASATANKL
jgi:hypothetical protein